MSRELELFQHLQRSNYAAALQLIKQTPDLDVNALDQDHCSFLMAAIENSHHGDGKPRYDFIEFLLKHPNFVHANTPTKMGSPLGPFQCALLEDDPHLMKLLFQYKDSKHINVLYHQDNQLIYAEQAERVTSIQDSQKVNYTLDFAYILPQKEKVLAVLLHQAVSIALEQDDTTLLQGLVDAGAKLYEPLHDGSFPLDLARKKPNSQVFRWLSDYRQKYISSNHATLLATKQLTSEHAERARTLIADHTERTRKLIQGAFKFFDYPAQSSTVTSINPAPPAGKNPGNH